LLRHADSHLDLNTAFDKRIAFISIDNSVETMIRAFLGLPKAKSGIRVTKQEIDEAGNIFPKLLDLIAKHAPDRLIGIDASDVEHYHRIRNTLYHEGTGLSVDDQYIRAYRGIAGVLLQNLFGATVGHSSAGPDSLERLVINWNNIERILRQGMEQAGLSTSHRWEEEFVANLPDKNDTLLLRNLRSARNRLVHSQSVDRKEVSHWVQESERLLRKISDATDSRPPATVTVSYTKAQITSDLHRYSLVVTVTLNRTPDQNLCRLSILWPLVVRARSTGLKIEEEKNLNGTRYIEFSLLVEERLWPGQSVKVIGGKDTARLDYWVDTETFEKVHSEPVQVFYTLYLQDWPPVNGSVGFGNLNIF